LYRKLWNKTKWKEERKDTLSRACGLVTAIVVLLASIYAFIALIGPTLVNSLSDLLRQERLDNYVNTVLAWVHDTFAGTPVDKWFS
jgi:sorbitol-specific phosphotransferase system component IIC